MKNKIFLLFGSVWLTNFAEAQSNFGKRKFSRNLFSKSVGFNLRKQKSEEQIEITLNKSKNTKLKDSAVTILVSSFKTISEIQDQKPQCDIIKTHHDHINAVSEAVKKEPLFPRKIVSENKTCHEKNISTTSIKETKARNSVHKIIDSNSESKKKSEVSTSTKDDLIEYGIYLLGFIVCLGYLLLLHYFPIIGAIVGLITLFAAVYYLIDGTFGLFEGFISMMGR